MITCPSLDQWQSILTADVPGLDEEALTKHAEACISCQAVLETLIRPQGLSLARQAQAEKETPLPTRQAAIDTPLHGQFSDLLLTQDSAKDRTPVDHSPLIPGYEILEELGRGGMGVVFKARHLELNRLVALKVLRDHALADAGLLARFRDEARAVARLQHPGIVQIHEIGTLEGQPYLALEYVPGPSLESYLQGTPQPSRDGAALMVPLAQAIRAAHQQGILHRDLKPANILLLSRIPGARPSEEARASGARLNDFDPKITDFGLAKPLDEDVGRTETGMVVGTPSYMAPEQATGQKQVVGPAVDIYALGAILYEMLTGRPPFKGVTAYDTIHLLLNEEPVPPRRLQPQVPRDLETICLKCLHKEPTQRYLTAADLVEDLECFLNSRPILARPAGRLERMGKWCRRYPAVASLLVIATLAALTASGLAAWAFAAEKQAVAERDEKDRQRQRAQDNEKLAGARLREVEAEKKRVEEEKLIHQSVRFFLTRKILAQADARVQAIDLLDMRRAATAMEFDPKLSVILERAASELASDRIEANFPNQPMVQAELLLTIGYTYRAMGHFSQAVTYLQRAWDLCAKNRGADDENTIYTLYQLAKANHSAGNLTQAIAMYEQASAGFTQLMGVDNRFTLHAQQDMAAAYRAKGNYSKAISLYEQVHAAQVKTLGADHPDSLNTLHGLGVALRDAKKLPEAIALLENAHAGLVKYGGTDYPDLGELLNNLGTMYAEAGNLVKAISLLEKARDIQLKQLRIDHPFTNITLANLAEVYQRAGRQSEALSLLETLRTAQVVKQGAENEDTLSTLNELGASYWRMKRFDKSVPLFEKLVKERTALQGPKHADTKIAVANLGGNYLDAGRVVDAIPWLEEAFFAGRKDPRLYMMGLTLLEAYARAGKTPETVALVEELRSGLQRRIPQASPQWAGVLALFGRFLVQVKEYTKAEPLLRESLTYRAKTQPNEWTTFDTQVYLGEALFGQSKFAEAEPLLLTGYQGLKKQEARIPGEDKPRLKTALERLVQVYEAQGNKEAAAKYRKQGEALSESKDEPAKK